MGTGTLRGGKPFGNKRWLLLHPAEEAEVDLETLVVAIEVIFVVVTTLVMEETPVVVMTFMVAMVVANMVAVGMSIWI